MTCYEKIDDSQIFVKFTFYIFNDTEFSAEFNGQGLWDTDSDQVVFPLCCPQCCQGCCFLSICSKL